MNGDGHLHARPGAADGTPAPGLHRIGDGGDALLYVPDGASSDRPAPLVVMLHGAGGTADSGISHLRPLADEAGLLLLAPRSVGQTWDAIRDGFGPDVERLDALLAEVFAACAVDGGHVAVGGFSDGASYALSLGLANGGLFTHVVAFSPGFIPPMEREGDPRIFVSHGDEDNVLPIGVCSRRIVPWLAHAGYRVLYREFAGGHTVPRRVAREAVEWLMEA
ncbi:MAG TPA: PHB depolymerase family esterase [Longimicrobium sp.]|nr:PHB depolymerase family esterase [Longimicrobium sp.]